MWGEEEEEEAQQVASANQSCRSVSRWKYSFVSYHGDDDEEFIASLSQFNETKLSFLRKL